MPYTNCASCGAKALVGATRCPRCQAPFVSYDVRGDKVPTVNCPNCGVQRPAAIGVCPNCLTSTAPRTAHMARGAVIIGAIIVIIIGVGYAVSRVMGGKQPVVAVAPPATAPDRDEQLVADSIAADASERARDSALAASATAAVQTPPVAVPTEVKTAQPASVGAAAGAVATKPAPVDPAMVPPRPAAPPSVAVPDSGRWDFYVATTWVRVRSAPKPGSEVLRMIDSAQKVRLGPAMNGWRAVRVGVDRGWVDPRLFKAAP